MGWEQDVVKGAIEVAVKAAGHFRTDRRLAKELEHHDVLLRSSATYRTGMFSRVEGFLIVTQDEVRFVENSIGIFKGRPLVLLAGQISSASFVLASLWKKPLRLILVSERKPYVFILKDADKACEIVERIRARTVSIPIVDPPEMPR